MKQCIFYLPYELSEHGTGARMLRPMQMIQAFEEIGYNVFVIQGYSRERKARISELKRKIMQGDVYDFMYTEAHTMPTLLTERHHFPTHPFLDFGFFNFIRKNGIKIGLFYGDIYWKFDNYGYTLPKWKRLAALTCYKFDILQYKRFINRLFVPDLKLCQYLNESDLTDIASELPPGAENRRVSSKKYCNCSFEREPLKVFYVGGLGNQYQITDLVQAVSMTENVELTICCRKPEWLKEKHFFAPFLNDKVKVVHKSSDELQPFFRQADICSLMFKKDKYIEMAKPFKAYEYLSYEIPVLSTKGTAIGNFVEKNGIGWNIQCEATEIAKIFRQVLNKPLELETKRYNCSVTKQKNLWTSRAKQVAAELR